MDLVFAVDRGCLWLLSNCLFSLARSGGAGEYRAYILSRDLGEGDREELERAVPEQVELHFITVPEGMFQGFPVYKRYPEQIYYRLAAGELLPGDVKRALYLDVDTIVINPLTELYAMDMEGRWFMGCTNVRAFLTMLNRLRLGLDPREEGPYVNTGVLMLDLEQMRRNVDLGRISAFAREKGRALWLPDQDILAALYGEHVKLLDPLIYNLSDRTLALHNAGPSKEKLDLAWVRQNTCVIHYFGKMKPWKKNYVGILDVFYDELLRDMAKT